MKGRCFFVVDEEETLCHDTRIKFRRFLHVIIDVDSCLCGFEGIDRLGALRHKYDEIAELTRKAMEGNISFGDVFSERLDIIQPRREDLQLIARDYIKALTPGAEEAIRLLQDEGVDIYLVSGGYDAAIFPLAEYLGLDRRYVYANRLLFDYEGRYVGYNKENPLCDKGGKTKTIEAQKKNGRIYGRVLIIGDSVSELETKSAVDLCVGFGGYVVRDAVVKGVDVFLSDCSFAALAPLVLGKQGVREVMRYKAMYRPFLLKGLQELQMARYNGQAVNLKREVDKLLSFFS